MTKLSWLSYIPSLPWYYHCYL